VGPHCSFCGTFTGPFSEIEGLFTVLICIPCLEVRLAQPDSLLGLHDPGQPWEQWGCPIEGCGRRFLGPWDLEGHTAAEHPAGRPSMSCCGVSEPAPAHRVPPQGAAGELTLPVCRRSLPTFLDLLVVVLVLVLVVIDDPQHFDEAEGGSQPAQGRLLVGVDLSHSSSRLPPRWLVAAGPQVHVDPAALELELINLALAVVLTAGLEGQHLQIAGEALELGQQVSYRHLRSVARQTL
jgi:hypothetical protein